MNIKPNTKLAIFIWLCCSCLQFVQIEGCIETQRVQYKHIIDGATIVTNHCNQFQDQTGNNKLHIQYVFNCFNSYCFDLNFFKFLAEIF